MKLIKLLVFLLFVSSCSNNIISNSEVERKNEYYNGEPDFNLTRLVAQNYVLEMSESFDWEGAEVGEFFPLYNPATDKITYLEYKVKKDNQDRGYVLISLKDDEPNIVESAHNIGARTCFELLTEKAKTTKIKAVRFSFTSYVALDDGSNSRSKGTVLASLGNIENELGDFNSTESRNNLTINNQYDDLVNQYKQQVVENGGYLDISKKYGLLFKDNIRTTNQSYLLSSRGKVKPKGKTHKRSIKSYSSSLALMRTGQFYINDKHGKYYSGCTPTAATIIAAYWDRVHGMSKMYPGTPQDIAGTYSNDEFSPNSNFRKACLLFRSYCGTIVGTGSTGETVGSGLYSYAYDHGYKNIKYEIYSADLIGSILYKPGINKLMTALTRDYPAAISYWEGKGMHHAVIYKVVVKEEEWGNYFDAIYSIDTGWYNTTFKDISAKKHGLISFTLIYR